MVLISGFLVAPHTQETPVGKKMPGGGNYVSFNNTVHLQVPISR